MAAEAHDDQTIFSPRFRVRVELAKVDLRKEWPILRDEFKVFQKLSEGISNPAKSIDMLVS